MNDLNATDTIVFFLQLTDELPVNFFYLATHFSELNITLVPIRPVDLMSLKLGQKEYVLSLQTKTESSKRMREFRKRFLDFAILNRKVCLFDMSSFSKIDIATKAEYLGCYHHITLPTKIANAVEKMSAIIYREKRQTTNWPGGRRPKMSINNLS